MGRCSEIFDEKRLGVSNGHSHRRVDQLAKTRARMLVTTEAVKSRHGRNSN